MDKCIWVEGKDKPKEVSYRGGKVKTSLIGTVVEDMRIQNCGYVDLLLREPPSKERIASKVFRRDWHVQRISQPEGRVVEATMRKYSAIRNSGGDVGLF